jgi:hypothetical protein
MLVICFSGQGRRVCTDTGKKAEYIVLSTRGKDKANAGISVMVMCQCENSLGMGFIPEASLLQGLLQCQQLARAVYRLRGNQK